MNKSSKKSIRAFSFEELADYCNGLNIPQYKTKQIYFWLWKRLAKSFDEMTDLSLSLRLELASKFFIHYSHTSVIQTSMDRTVKVAFQLSDNKQVEGVLIPTESRVTACISSQVGCPLGCKFCATGYLGKFRNLMCDEIADQVILLNELAIKHYGMRLTNIVFMGMGEPLLNYRQVLKAIAAITSPDGLGISNRRITLSTAGVSKMICKLGDDKVKFGLALSLHAANDEKRDNIMPINRENNLSSLKDALKYFYSKTQSSITYEYILFEGFNDSLTDAKDLVRFCSFIPVKVNIIEYNPIKEASFKYPDQNRIAEFVNYLKNKNINVHIRKSRGQDIGAACGQLANQSLPSKL